MSFRGSSIFGDVQRFIFCVRDGGRVTSGAVLPWGSLWPRLPYAACHSQYAKFHGSKNQAEFVIVTKDIAYIS